MAPRHVQAQAAGTGAGVGRRRPVDGAVRAEREIAHRTGIWIGNQKARRDRLDEAQLAGLAELGIHWTR